LEIRRDWLVFAHHGIILVVVIAAVFIAKVISAVMQFTMGSTGFICIHVTVIAWLQVFSYEFPAPFSEKASVTGLVLR